MLVVFCTITAGKGEELADRLVNSRLAACVNIVSNVKSIYHWQGKVEKDTEELMIIKTEDSLKLELENFIKNNHSYAVPEIIFIKPEHVNENYLNWLVEETIKNRG